MKIALAADLHFGSVPDGLSTELRETILRQEPSIIVIAGDLTLRARRGEFEEAGQWLRSLSPPPLVIPGNHDLPYWNLIQRFANPFQRYRKATASDTLMPITEKPGWRSAWFQHFSFVATAFALAGRRRQAQRHQRRTESAFQCRS